MDVDEFQSQIYNSKYPRINTNNGGRSKLAANYQPEDEDDADDTPTPTSNNDNAAVTVAAAQPQSDSMLRGWHNSSRIFRVSRASGGKDRHSKVLTSKGLRDRRVRLSVSTAIQFYDLQDRLGYDQPSKAVEWLIRAAADSISELPSLHGPFPETPRQLLCDPKLGFESAGLVETQQHQKNPSMSKSASSTSETSKGSGLSLTQTDVRVNQRVKARERARERAKEKDQREGEQMVNVAQRRRQTANPISHPNTSSTFTELLTGAIGGNQTGSTPNSTPMMMDYFTNAGMISAPPTASRSHHHQPACLFLGQTQMPNSVNMSGFHLTTGEHHYHHQHDVQHFSFGQENLIPSGTEYDLNFSISSSPSSLAGYTNRGTLQSNSPSAASSLLHHNLQRYAASVEGPNVPAFFLTAASSSSMDNNQHHFSTGLDGSLHLYYGDGCGHPTDHKDKRKN